MSAVSWDHLIAYFLVPCKHLHQYLLALRKPSEAGTLGEYDGNNNLLRKYIYGPGTKQIRNPKPEARNNIKIQIPIRHKSTIVNRKS